jgi:ferrous iron transport protein A
MPLFIAPLNKLLLVIKLLVDAKTKKHLENLGIAMNSKITVISNSGGNVVCLVKNVRIALDHDIASRIVVSVSKDEDLL